MCDSSRVSTRALFSIVLGVALTVTVIAIVVVPGVQRGGWLEVIAVFAVIVVFAFADRWLRRLTRRR